MYKFAAVSNGKRKPMRLFPLTICSPCKWKFVVCPFVDEETNGRVTFPNGLFGLAHLCKRHYHK